jgi:hypothetical protein
MVFRRRFDPILIASPEVPKVAIAKCGAVYEGTDRHPLRLTNLLIELNSGLALTLRR